MQLTARFYASQVRKAAETLGVPLPAALVEQLDHADRLTHTAETMLNHGGDLNEAVLDAIEAGRDFHTDKTVRRLALERMLANQGHGIADAARQRSLQQKRAALTAHADVVLGEWAAALEPHTAALTAAAAALPVDNLEDVQDVIARGPDVVQHWSNAKKSVTAWSAAVQGFTALADATGIDYTDHRPLILTDADPLAWQAARIEGVPHIDAWTLARNGLALTLATLRQFAARVTRYEASYDTAAAN